MENKFLFFSAEAKSPAGYHLINLIHPIEISFNKDYSDKYSSAELENITIVFICTDEDMIAQGFYKERKYISHKNKYADIRLHIPYDEFLKADLPTRKQMMWNVITRAFAYLKARKVFTPIDELEEDLSHLFWSE